MADYRSALKATRRPRSKPATTDRYGNLGRIYAVLDSVGESQARESAPDTAVTAYDIGRAYVACRPELDEDDAFDHALVRVGHVRPSDRAEFVRGFRSVDEPTRVRPAPLTVSLPESLDIAARAVMRRERDHG